jgi:inosine/xanthosine triphosphate pyrophosphatase family protein
MAQLATAEKREVSHRGQAFGAIKADLVRLVRGR